MPTLRKLLTDAEGYRKDVYPDPKKKNVPTVGIGHRVVAADKLKIGDVIDDKRIDEFFAKDTAKAMAAARTQAAKAGIKDSNFIVYLAMFNFQLGESALTKDFKKTWAYIMEGNYGEAAKEAARSKWNKQSPNRVKDFQGALLSLPDKKK